MLECVVNVSEGRDRAVIARLADAGGPHVLDVHTDGEHNRTVLTLCGPASAEGAADLEQSVRAVAACAVEEIDLRVHRGAHPRIGALDVVPFVALERRDRGLVDGPMAEALGARDRFASWAGDSLGLPCFLYGPERSLPEVRREAWRTARPDRGPSTPHPSAGAAAVGARPVLVAYNLWLSNGADVATARAVASRIRSDAVRALGLQLGQRVQVSCNLVRPWAVGPGAAFDAVALALAEVAGSPERSALGIRETGLGIERAELVGLVPAGVLDREPRHRWPELGLGAPVTIEARLEQAGLDGGSS